MKILLIGKNGQVGWELARILPSLGELVAIGRENLDLTDTKMLREAIRSIKPDIIVNAVAYTAVDKAESEPELAMAINAIAPGIMAEEAKKLNSTLIHYSTDYVFDGTKRTPYDETDPTNPLNVYGRSKLAGEVAIVASGVSHLIFRTSWVYSNRGSNFFLTVKRLLREKKELRIVDDQIGAPTSARAIAEGTSKALKLFLQQGIEAREKITGLYHLTASEVTSWHGFAEEVMAATVVSENRAKIVPITTSEYLTSAKRPLNSVLSNAKFLQIFGFRLPWWKDSLRQLLTQSP